MARETLLALDVECHVNGAANYMLMNAGSHTFQCPVGYSRCIAQGVQILFVCLHLVGIFVRVGKIVTLAPTCLFLMQLGTPDI